MDLKTRIKIEKALKEYFHKNYSINNYPVELEGLKVKASELLELIEENYNDFWRDQDELEDLSWGPDPGYNYNIDEKCWEEILDREISELERKKDFYERYSKIAEMRKRQKIKNESRIKN